VTERRRCSRSLYARGVLPPLARIRPGRDVIIVNLSESGALVEGCWRLRPGARVELVVRVVDQDRVIAGHIMRCYVHALPRQQPVRYRTAIRFELVVRGLPQPDVVGEWVKACPITA
jgi:hypothetical protein